MTSGSRARGLRDRQALDQRTAVIGHPQRRGVRQLWNQFGSRVFVRICREVSIDVFDQLASGRAERCGEQHRRPVGPTAAERDDAVRSRREKARNDDDAVDRECGADAKGIKGDLVRAIDDSQTDLVDGNAGDIRPDNLEAKCKEGDRTGLAR